MQKHNQKGEIPLMTPELAKELGAQFPNGGKTPSQSRGGDNQPTQIGRTQFMGNRKHHGLTGGDEEESE